MTASTLKLIRWEWFKLQRRWMPWILLGFLLLFSQLSVWGSLISYTRLQSSGGSVSLPAVTDASGRGGQFRTVSCNDLVADPSAVVPDATPLEVITGLQAQCRQQAEQLQGQLWRQYDQFTLPGSFPRSFGIIRG